jgi:hypothetical protein
LPPLSPAEQLVGALFGPPAPQWYNLFSTMPSIWIWFVDIPHKKLFRRLICQYNFKDLVLDKDYFVFKSFYIYPRWIGVTIYFPYNLTRKEHETESILCTEEGICISCLPADLPRMIWNKDKR